MTYNVRYFSHAIKGLSSTQKGIRWIAEAVAGLEERPDVLCLQEVESRSMRSRPPRAKGLNGQTQLDAFMGALEGALERNGRPERYDGHYFPAHAYRLGPARFYTTGLAFVVRRGIRLDPAVALEPHEITHRRFRATGRLKQSRICAHLRFLDEADRSWDVFNTHLSLPAFLTKRLWASEGRMGWGENQLMELDTLADYVESRAASDRFLVVGDFNALPGSSVYDRLAERLGAHDAFARSRDLGPDELRRTWPTCGFLHYRMRLDHVFAGSGAHEASFEGTHRFGDPAGHWHGLSDHVPIVGRFD